MALTQQRLKELFYYSDGFLYFKEGEHKSFLIGRKVGTVDVRPSQNRRYTVINKKRYLCARLIFLYHNGYLPLIVDHKDRNRLNDRIENLRPATFSENSRNMNSRKNSSSKYLGVNYHITNKTWQAQIGSFGQQIYLGSYKTEIEAATAYNAGAIIHHGEFANLNIIE